jgi:zinc protease
LRPVHRLTILLLLCLAAALRPALALDVKTFDYTLDNGLRLIVIPDHRSQIVTHSVWYQVGAADEISGKTGLAHYLEHLMFKGTTKHPDGDFDHILSKNGASGNAFTTEDYTAYYQRTTADRLPVMMELEADRMQNLVIDDALVKTELQVVREERRERTENNPQALLAEQIDAALFTAHPYGRPTVGWMSDIASLTGDDAKNFYMTYYTPANAIVIVAGDVEPEKVLALAKTSYGALKNTSAVKPRVRTPEPAANVERRLVMKDERTSNPIWMRIYLVPSYTRDEEAAINLAFLGEIVGDGVQSRLNKSLVLQQKLASYVSASYGGNMMDSGKFTIFAAPVDGVDLARIETAVDAVMSDVLQSGVTSAELDRARNMALASQVYELDSQFGLVMNVGTSVTTGQPLAQAFDTSNWAKVTPESILVDAHKYIVPENAVTAELLPKAKD